MSDKEKVSGDYGWLVNLDLPEVQCDCPWNPDNHDKTCPVYLRDRLSDAQHTLITEALRGEVDRLNEQKANWVNWSKQLDAQLAQQQVPEGWKLVPVEPTPEMVSAAEEAHMPFGDMDIALRMAILSAPSAPATVQGVNAQLLEAATESLAEIQAVMQEAYNSATPVCCGRAQNECCGSPDPEWNEYDHRTMDRFAPIERALRAAIAAARQEGGKV